MERIVRVAAAQIESKMCDKQYNLDKACHYIKQAAQEGADIVCFPELFYTGYDLSRDELREHSEKADGHMFRQLSQIAKSERIHIIASYPERIDISSVTFASAMLIGDNGDLIGNHRKVYLWVEEQGKFRPGEGFRVYDTRLGKIGLLICYEMEYPEPARILALKGAEMLFLPAAYMGIHLMDRYLTAIALQNLIDVIGVNTIGNKKNGSSKVLDQLGNVVKEASRDKEELIMCEIDISNGHRKNFPHMQDFKLKTLDWALEAAEVYRNRC